MNHFMKKPENKRNSGFVRYLMHLRNSRLIRYPNNPCNRTKEDIEEVKSLETSESSSERKSVTLKLLPKNMKNKEHMNENIYS